MNLKTIIAAIAVALPLASCGSIYPSDDGARHWGSPQTAGWTTSPQVREAEQKSIARDMPFASVTAKGRIVQR
jgi:hypothetical protein